MGSDTTSITSRAVDRLSRWWFAPAPAERLAGLRILVGTFACVYLATRFGELIATAQTPIGNFEAVGIVRFALPAWLAIVLAVATLVLMIAFTFGVAYRVVAPLAAASLLWTLTYRNAWGQVFHTENLLVMHVIALACTPAADAWAWRATPIERPAGYGWAVKLIAAITVATYVVAGVAKLRIAGLAWLHGEQLRDQIAIDNLRKALLGDPTSVLAVPLLDHPGLFVTFAAGTLIVELGAPLALVHRRIGQVWAFAAWGFHVGVLALMSILFPYAITGFAYASLFPIERPLGKFATRLAALRRRNVRASTAG